MGDPCCNAATAPAICVYCHDQDRSHAINEETKKQGWVAPCQEAYDAECAALARALQVAATRDHTLGLVTILTDCQAAIGRMSSDEPGPGQKYALEATRHIVTLRAKEPKVKAEIRWCLSHQGIEGNEIADEWGKLAADEPHAHGAGWFSTTNPDGTARESFRSRRTSPTSSEGSPKGDGRTPKTGSGRSLPTPATANTGQAKSRNRTLRWPRPTSASPPGFTS